MSTVLKTVSMAVVVLVMMAAAPPAEEPPAQASMRTLRTSVVVDATREQLWDAFTTREGVESWMVPLAEVDFRMGGTLKATYDKAGGIAGPNTIVHHVLAYDPYRMIAMRFDAPESAGDKNLAESCWWMIFLEDLGAGKTRVTESMAGFGEGAEWDKVYAFFEKGNQWTLQQLVKKFAGSSDGKTSGDVLAVVRRLQGGEWVHESVRPDGKTFRSRNVYSFAPDGASLVGSGFLGDAEGMYYHGSVQVWKDPESGAVKFQNIDEHGGVATGGVVLDGPDTTVWDWTITSAGGKKTAYTVRITFEGPDAYRFVLRLRGADGQEQQLVEVAYKRVDKAPESFTKMKPSSAGAAAKG